jgi:hypothetical protein
MKTYRISLGRIQFILLLPLLFTLLQCSKEEAMPSADFISDKPQYVEGETAFFTQKSANAETFRWILPDGTTQKGESASYLLPVLGVDGVFQIKLEAFSKSGAKSDFSVKNFSLTAATGNAMIWSYSAGYPVGFPFTRTVSVDNAEVFKGDMLNIPEPSCGDQHGCAYFPVKVGTHIIVIEPTQQTFTVQMTKNDCVKIKI